MRSLPTGDGQSVQLVAAKLCSLPVQVTAIPAVKTDDSGPFQSRERGRQCYYLDPLSISRLYMYT